MLTFIQAGISCQWVNDSQRFLLGHFDAIHNSPSQIYHSALPLSPSLSWLPKCYTAEFSQEVKVIKGLPGGWGTCSRTVALDHKPLALACWKDIIAVGTKSKDILLLDAITGSQVAVLSGHTDRVRSLTFLPDGTSLVSGSNDMALKLWDIQTGGVVKTLCGHTSLVYSVSISSDCSMIASGSEDNTIRLWNIQTGECCCVIEQQGAVYCVCFSPTDPQRLISVSSGVVQQWDINGLPIGPTYQGSHAAFSSDGSHFVLCRGKVAMVQSSDSGAIVAKCPPDSNVSDDGPDNDSDDDSDDNSDEDFKCCCFSPNG